MRDWGNQLINLAFLKGRRDASFQRWTADYQTSVVAETARQTQRDRLAAMREQSELIVGREAAKGKAFAAGTSETAQRDRARVEEAEAERVADTVRYTAMGKARGLEGSYSSAQDVQMGMLMRKTDNAALASQRLERAKELTIERYPDDAPQIEFFDTLSDYDQFYKEKEDQKIAAEAKAKAAEIAATKEQRAVESAERAAESAERTTDTAAYNRAEKIAAQETEARVRNAKKRAYGIWQREMEGLTPADDGWIDHDDWWRANAQRFASPVTTPEDVLKRRQKPSAPAPATGGGQRRLVGELKETDVAEQEAAEQEWQRAEDHMQQQLGRAPTQPETTATVLLFRRLGRMPTPEEMQEFIDEAAKRRKAP